MVNLVPEEPVLSLVHAHTARVISRHHRALRHSHIFHAVQHDDLGEILAKEHHLLESDQRWQPVLRELLSKCGSIFPLLLVSSALHAVVKWRRK